STPGGGGFGNPLKRKAQDVAEDVKRGYYTADQAAERFGVALSSDGNVEPGETECLRLEEELQLRY
ncbi:MAG: hypothetical protein MI743_15080, partial [Sneathiellales bacterium]|nr:hypothetical protein [Sneathiellales bacterium]